MVKRSFDAEKIVLTYVAALIQHGIRPERILLFGSYARGNATQWSDIDLAVISKDFENIAPLKRLELLSLATWKVDSRIEALGYTPAEIAKRGDDSIIWEEIQNNHKIVYKAA